MWLVPCRYKLLCRVVIQGNTIKLTLTISSLAIQKLMFSTNILKRKPKGSLIIGKRSPLGSLKNVIEDDNWRDLYVHAGRDLYSSYFEIFSRYWTCQRVHFVGKAMFLILVKNYQTIHARIQKLVRKLYHGWIITILVLFRYYERKFQSVTAFCGSSKYTCTKTLKCSGHHHFSLKCPEILEWVLF